MLQVDSTLIIFYVFGYQFSLAAFNTGGLWTTLGTFTSFSKTRAALLSRECIRQCEADSLCAYVEIRQETNECTVNMLPPAPDPANITEFLATPGHFILQKCVRDCADVYLNGFTRNVNAVVCPTCHKGGRYIDEQCFNVRCDQQTDGGGWTIFQSRYDGSVSFARPWSEYKKGFGSISGEFWLGNDKLHKLTSDGSYELTVLMADALGRIGYARYKEFSIGDESEQYRLSVSGFSGYPADGLSFHNGMMFSTFDRDNDVSSVHCSNFTSHGGWWFQDCAGAYLNGQYYPSGVAPSSGQGLHWYRFDESSWTVSSLLLTQMRVRQNAF